MVPGAAARSARRRRNFRGLHHPSARARRPLRSRGRDRRRDRVRPPRRDGLKGTGRAPGTVSGSPSIALMSHTKTNLRDSEGQAVKHGFSDHQEARFPRNELDAAATGLAYLRSSPTSARHAHIVTAKRRNRRGISGRGRVKLDDELVELMPLDAVRVSWRDPRLRGRRRRARDPRVRPAHRGRRRDDPRLLRRTSTSRLGRPRREEK